MKNPSTLRLARLGTLASAIAALLAAPTAPAASRTWDGGGADANLTNALNWATDVAPLANDTLSFDGATRLTPNNDLTAVTIFNSIAFNVGAGAFTLGGNSIGLNGGVTDHSLTVQSISAAIVLSATETINVSSINGSLALSGVISGTTFGLTKTGSGLLTLSNSANTFTGPVAITGGTLSVATDSSGVANALGSGASAVNFTLDGGALRVTASGTPQISTGRSMLLGNSGVGTGGTVDNVNLTLYNGIMANNGGTNNFTKTGAGELRLGGVCTYTGSTFVNQGTLKLDFTALAGTTTNIINSASTLVLGGPISGLNNSQLKVVGIQPAATLNVTSKSAASSSQTFTGLALNPGNNALTTTLTAGGNVLIALGAINHTAGGTITFTLPAVTPSALDAITTTTANDASGILGAWARTSTGDWAANDGSGHLISFTAYTTLAGVTPTLGSGAATNVKITSGSTGNINFATGTTDVNTILATDPAARTLNVASGDTLRLGAFGAIVDSDATANVVFTVGTTGSFLTAGGAPNTAGELVMTSNSSTLNSGNGITLASSIVNNGTGAVTVVSNGNARTILSASNSYTGNTYINSGELFIQSPSGFGAGDVRIQAGGQAYINNGGTVTNNFFISGDSGEGNTANLSGCLRLAGSSGATTLSGTITLISDARIAINGTTVAAPHQISGKITGNFNLDLANANSATLAVISVSNTTNDFSGNLSLNGYVAGTASQANRPLTVMLGANQVIPDGAGKGNVIINGGSSNSSTLDLNGKSETINGLMGGANPNQAVVTNSVVGTSVLTVGGGDTTATFSGKIQDAGVAKSLGIAKIGLGTQVLAGTNTYSGNTTVNAGTLRLTAANASNQTSIVTIATTGAVLDLAYLGTDTVDKLFIGSTQLPAGIYGATGSGATTLDSIHFAGSGTLTVTTGGGSSNYASWANDPTKGNIPGELASGDFDSDGLTNLIEYALGKNPRVPSQPAGVLAGNAITFTKGVDAITNSDVSWLIETSTTLTAGSWTTQVTQPAGDPSATISYTLTPSTPLANFARLKITQN